jgi:hypothetical protein
LKPFVLEEKRILFQWTDFWKFPYYRTKNILIFNINPCRILENPSISVLKVMNILGVVWERFCQDGVKLRILGVNERVRDEECDIGLAFCERLDIIRFVMMIGWNPLRKPHLNHSKL